MVQTFKTVGELKEFLEHLPDDMVVVHYKSDMSKLRVGADSFAEAQYMVCDKMPLHKMTVAFIFPFTEEDME